MQIQNEGRISSQKPWCCPFDEEKEEDSQNSTILDPLSYCRQDTNNEWNTTKLFVNVECIEKTLVFDKKDFLSLTQLYWAFGISCGKVINKFFQG